MRSSETATSMMYIRPSHMLSTWMTRGRCRESPPAVTVMAANRGTPPSPSNLSYSWRSRRRTRTASAWSMRPWPCGLSFWPAHGVLHLSHGGILNPRAGFPMSDLRCQVILDMRFLYKLDFQAIGRLLFQSDSANLRHQILITSKHIDCLLLVFGQNNNWYCKYQTIKLELLYRGLVLDIPN